jgi:hypothetical protein
VSNLDQYSRRPGVGSGKRFVPPTTALAVLFGGFLVQFGAGFFAFGMIFWWIFGAQSDVTSWYQFSGDLTQVRGSALAVEDTGISEGGGEDSPGTPIYKVSYSFEPKEGGHAAGFCYGTGMYLAPGTPVDVEYAAGDPGTSRIVGSRKRPLDMWGLFVAIFPLIGLALMFFGLRSNARALHLLRLGKQARGRLVSKEPTNTKINNQMVYKLTFEYADEAGETHRMSDRTHHTHLVEDEQTERLFYNPRNPSEGKLVDLLPGRPRVDPDGSIGWVGAGATALRALLPVGGAALHIGIGLIFYA